MKKIFIAGAGRSGLAAAELLLNEYEVTLWDEKSEENFDKEKIEALRSSGVSCVFGPSPKTEGFFAALLSPGVSPSSPAALKLKENGAFLTGELEESAKRCKGKITAVTGTNGKTTVTTLIGEMLKEEGLSFHLVGNIGTPLALYVKDSKPSDIFVTEVSSFQLETAKSFHPAVSVLLNVTPDHMDRHKTFENYMAAKAGICKNQTAKDVFIYNEDDENCKKAALNCKAALFPFSMKKELKKGAYIKDGSLFISFEGETFKLCEEKELLIPGAHNVENALAASSAAFFSGAGPKSLSRALKSFKGVPHRIEFVRNIGGVRYVNDSKGTNPVSTEKAIEAEKAPIILIAGGYEKNSDFSKLISNFHGKVKALLLLGATADRFEKAALDAGFSKENIYILNDMKGCVEKAHEISKPGDTVLLSPASASWDMYDNFEERGEDFKRNVFLLSSENMSNTKGNSR